MTNNEEQVQIDQKDIDINQYIVAGASIGAVSGMMAGIGLETVIENIPVEILAGSLVVTGAIAFGALAKVIHSRKLSSN